MRPAEIADCAKKIGALSGQSTTLNDSATSASVPSISWGALGHVLGLYEQYDGLLGELHSHFTKMTEGFGKIDSALTQTAASYRDSDHTSAGEFGKVLGAGLANAKAPPVVAGGATATSNAGAVGASYGKQWAVDGGKGNLISQTAKLIPLGGSSYSMIKDGAKLGDDIAKGDVEAIAKDVVTVLSDMNSFMQDGMALAGAIADPLNFLISKGLGWLLNVVTPLKQAVDLVTGDPAATSKAAGSFNDIAKKTEELAKSYDEHLHAGLQNWKSEAGDAAAKKLTEFHDGIDGTATTAGHVASLLQGSSMFMQVAEDIIKGILSDLIEWLVVTWIAAQLAAVPTCGASEAVAAGATPIEAGISTTKATGEVNKVRQLIQKIMNVLKKIRDFLGKSKVGKAFVEGAAKGPKTFGDAALKSVGKQFNKAKGVDQSTGPSGEKYNDPVKRVNTYAGYADGIYKTVTYDQHGNGQDSETTDSQLDI